MSRIKYWLVGSLAVLGALWFWAEPSWPQPLTYFGFRTIFMQASGVIAIGAMSVAMVLATRPAWLEPSLNGLDKMYRLHKWLGIAALAAATVHWLWAQGTKWAVGWGWLTRPARKPRAAADSMGSIESALRGWRGLAEDLGEWAFYAVAVLLVLALVKRFPYRLFAKTHHWMAAIYLVLAFHTLVLVQFSYWAQPVGWALAMLLASGTVSAVWVLLGRVGAQRTAHGVIESLQTYPALNVLETTLRMDPGWPGHRPGQFAFAMSNPKEGPHPYTLASAWVPEDRRITFITKALGDHTRRLPDAYGSATGDGRGALRLLHFRRRQARQIWIGAGIGITPFMARMKQLAQPKAKTHARCRFVSSDERR
jgi:predicted ferric reductase